MKKVLFAVFIIFAVPAKSEESKFQIIINGVVDGIPLQVDNIKKNKKSFIGLELKGWSMYPDALPLMQEKIIDEKFYDKKKNDLYISLKYKF